MVQANSFTKIFTQSQPVEQTCPRCGAKTKRIHDYRLQEVQDTPLLGKQVVLLLRERRYLCSYCRKRLTRPYSFPPSYHYRTRRLASHTISLSRQIFSLKQIAEFTGVSVQTVCHPLGVICYPSSDQLPRAFSIDEFGDNASTDKYQCILIDPEKRRILGILPNRTQNRLIDYQRNIPRKEHLKVKLSVCGIRHPCTELAQTFFPNTAIVVGEYHFIWQMTWTIEDIRKRLQRSMPVPLHRYYKGSRKLILTRHKELRDENKQTCDLMLHYGEDLRLTYRVKEWFYDICQMETYRQQQRELGDWIVNAQSCGIKEFEVCARTYRAWRKKVLNAFKYGLTNGPTGGSNDKIKALRRSNYEIRNFKRFRARILRCISQDKEVGNAEAYLACLKSVKSGTKYKKSPFHRIGAGF